LFAFLLAPMSNAQAAPCTNLLSHEVVNILGEKVNLCEHAGKVVLVVNTASECGYTPQYKGLQALHERYKRRGLVILGFPSNDFGKQEPGSNKEIATSAIAPTRSSSRCSARPRSRQGASPSSTARQGDRRAPAVELPQVPGRARRPQGRVLQPNVEPESPQFVAQGRGVARHVTERARRSAI
jgi:hypothetical protein